MNVVGHEDVTDEKEVEARADFSEDLHCDVFASHGGEEFPSLIASECDEVQVAAADDAFEVVRHKKEAEPTLADPARVGHPTVVLVNAEGISYAGILCVASVKGKDVPPASRRYSRSPPACGRTGTMKKPYRYILITLGAVWVIGMLVLSPEFVAAHRETKNVLRAFDQYSASLVNQRFDDAYNYCSVEFQNALPLDSFANVQRTLQTEFGPLRSVDRSALEVHGSGTPMKWRAVIDADLKYEKRTLRFEFVFHKEGERWVLFGAEKL